MIKPKPQKVSCIKFGNGGHIEIIEDKFPTHLSGYYAPYNWEPTARLDYPDGIPVIDGRLFYTTDKGIEWAIKGPMLTNKAAANESKNKDLPPCLKCLTVFQYMKALKKFDSEHLVRYGHIESMSIIWEE